MDYITTTNLRTKSTELVQSLRQGKKVSLIHRSQVIGVIEPKKEEEPVKFNPEKFRAAIKGMMPKQLVPKSQRDKVYRKHLEEKYGKGIS